MRVAVGIDGGSSTIKAVLIQEGSPIEVIAIAPGGSRPLRTARDLLRSIRQRIPAARVCLGITGTAGRTLCQLLGMEATDESVALAAAFTQLYPDVRTVIGMGMESQRLLLLEPDEVSGRLRIEESTLGHKCAAGSGSFIEHMRKRLNYASTEEFARVALETESPATLSGRCAVFTESDIVHLYQKGTSRERIAAGVHQAICRNYVACMIKGREVKPRVAFIGGVALNPAVVKYLTLEMGLEEGTLFVPEHARTMEAIGAALRAETEVDLDEAIRLLDEHLAQPISYPTAPCLSLERTEILQPPVEEQAILLGSTTSGEQGRQGTKREPTYIPLAALGVDIGSVSTKAALITRENGRYRVLAAYYRRTNGDPLAAVRDVVGVIHRQVEERGYRFGRIVAATTGSGRYLTADYLGAELIKNEITAQAHGALAFIPEVESIFEIGGQDSKYIALKNGVIVDFEMNKACAAGTGAFLEKQAATLGVPLEEFGDRALAGKNPPELDWQCTVFSESAVHYYRQNNVSVEDLCAGICMASVRNYLHKNVGNRPIGKVVAFQGAVAFNKGMVAAYETILGRRIVVPPYPHLTGAIGAAKIAYEEAPPQATFRGFEALVKANYQVSSFECKGCPNRCDVNTFQIEGGEKYYYNDRCERFSGRQKRRVQADLPDLFAEREALLMADDGLQAPEGAPRVGIPRVGMFNDYYPFYRAFFTTLGFQVVVSEQTNNQIIREGVQTVAAETCFPIKVAHGHVRDILRKEIDYLFLPAVMRSEPLDEVFCESQTCPYIQALPDLLRAALRLDEQPIPVWVPHLHFRRGKRHLVREFTRVLCGTSGNGKVARGPSSRLFRVPNQAEEAGNGDRRGTPQAARAAFSGTAAPSFSRQEIERAVEAGLQALDTFRHRLIQRGEEILKALPQDATAFVVMGRPYTLHDPAVNMHIGRKIQDLGILAIPQDMLPLAKAGVSDTWHAIYARQIQNRLAAARLVRQDPRLRAVVLTYFGCGPDSFANQFLRDELREPAYIMQIDEHTADAGVITRIEAFADTIRAHSEPEPFTPFTVECVHPSDLNGKILWIPDACSGAQVLAAAFRAYDIHAEVLPRSPDPALNLARAAIPEDVCVPALFTTEDILYRTRQSDFNPEREAFFQGNATGPCRYGMYSLLQKRILDRQNLVNVDIATLGARQVTGGLSTTSTLVVWDGLVTHDLLEKMLLHTRPYEQNSGECDRIFARYLQEVCEALRPHRELVESARGKIAVARGEHLERFQDILRRAQKEFAAVPRREEKRPLVGLIGEFYVRIHDRANQDVIRKLERGGVEVWLAPMTEFLSYANRIASEIAGDEFRDTFRKRPLIRWLVAGFQDWLAVRDEHLLWQAALPYLEGFEEIPPAELIDRGSEFVSWCFGGEAICSMGKAADMVQRGVDGIVNVVPFNCMPGTSVQALSYELRRRYGNVPFLTLDYDGFTDSSRDSRLASFLAQVRERWTARRNSSADSARVRSATCHTH